MLALVKRLLGGQQIHLNPRIAVHYCVAGRVGNSVEIRLFNLLLNLCLYKRKVKRVGLMIFIIKTFGGVVTLRQFVVSKIIQLALVYKQACLPFVYGQHIIFKGVCAVHNVGVELICR